MNKLYLFVRKNTSLFLVLLLILITSIIKLIEVKDYNFPFTMDQGRDMVDIRHMVVTKTPRLVGPTTSINGVLLGPFWYYFNLPAFLLGEGDPAVIVYWQIIWYQLSAFIMWIVLRKKNLVLANVLTIFYLFMPIGFNTARYFWNANAMPFFTYLFFAILIYFFQKQNEKRSFFLGFFSGLAMQIEAAFGVLLFPFSFLFMLYRKQKIRNLVFLTLGFFLTLLPQIIFEFRHQFIMTKIFIAEFSGAGNMLGEKIDMHNRLLDRWNIIVDLVRHSSHIPETFVFLIFIIASIYLVYKSITQNTKIDILTHSAIIFILLAAVFYLLFPQKLKSWYILGFSVPLVIVLGSFISYLLQFSKKTFKIISIFIISLTIIFSIDAQIKYIKENVGKVSNDKSNMKNEIASIDWVYQDAKGRPFKAFNYLPSVYDFPYNYLFWWYGYKKYGYRPNEVAYLPNQPEYIKDVDKIWTKTLSNSDNNLTYLIIENDSENDQRTISWLGNFSKICLDSKVDFSWKTIIEKRINCVNK